ncbi:sugar ABC transporter permease [Kaistia geumhonensis]|uniref:Multiple sugar transport system permease protein n=1 Tax=Kaistia geumhonensis TaxID=410839 RepID=A0ABU0M7C5_9HYPH|nr:sugar ABC transporter permease [Kaistia geumhonensis]MCX5477923.1 sugar ABC transporter permease [Kaistia geumhonensis]MDQ0516864.1 multiple sugar transport system permease protein [Kaistia geumhonensis]
MSAVDLSRPEAGTWRASARAWWRTGDALPFLLLAPSVVLILAVIAYPMLTGFWYGFTDGSLLKYGRFVGLDNYVELITSRDFRHALWFSLVFAVFNVVGCYALGLGLALLLNQDVPGRAFFRVALLLPWIVPSIVSIVSWRWMMADERALFNQVIGLFGGSPVYFLSDQTWAVVMVIAIKIWRSFPFMMLSLLAALQGIDRSLYEAASLDGASRWNQFRFVTLPQLRNISIVLALLMTIWTVNDFDTPWLLTQGGPANATENLVLLAYRYTFGRNDVGLGSATSFVTLIILMILVVFLLRRQKER